MTNPLRQQMIRRAVTRTQFEGHPIDVEHVRWFLPGPHAKYELKLRAMDDFLLDDDDLAPWRAAEPEPIEAVEIEHVEPTPQPVESVEPRQVRYGKLDAKAIELERECADLRFALDAAVRDELAARHELDSVARSFMAGFGVPQTAEQLLRQHVASENETRRKIAAGELPGRRRRSTVGPSVLDKYAAAQRGGQPGFAGRGYAHGAYPSSMRGQMAPRMTPQDRPKLPSDR